MKPWLANIAIANIANLYLRGVCDYRILRVMQTPASTLINALGGTTAVAKLIKSPTSTVHSWRKNGIPQARLDHLKLAARAKRMKVDFETLAIGAVAERADTPVAA